MGHAYRASIQKIKWPVQVGAVSTNVAKYVVFVATGYASIAEAHGGINIFAYDLQTGVKLWTFSQAYEDSVNDIPGAITSFSTKNDGFVDRIYVGDMNGRMWELDAVTGDNPHGEDNGKQIPLWNAGVGNPISVSPVVTRINPVVVIFGTGGADWAANDINYHIYAVNATDLQENPSYAGGAGTLVWDYELPLGEKVWSTPTVSEGQLFIATSIGSMESIDPRQDIASGTGKLRTFDLKDGTLSGDAIDVGKARGSIYIDRGQASLTSIDNTITHIGDGDYAESNFSNVVLKAWRQLME
jgi:Tfp pilus tip-associated adhesin PilY1